MVLNHSAVATLAARGSFKYLHGSVLLDGFFDCDVDFAMVVVLMDIENGAKMAHSLANNGSYPQVIATKQTT